MSKTTEEVMPTLSTGTGIRMEDLKDFKKSMEDISFFAEKYLGITLTDWQKDIISQDKIRRITARQMGFTMMSIIKVLHSAVFSNDKSIMYMSLNRMSCDYKRELFLDFFYKASENLKGLPGIRECNKSNIFFDNGVRITFLSYNQYSYMIGRAVSELYLEDCNFAKEDVFESFVHDAFPALASGKQVKIWAWSTKKRIKSDLDTNDIDNIHRINFSPIESIPYWYRTDLYAKYKYLKEFLTPEQIKKEYLLEV